MSAPSLSWQNDLWFLLTPKWLLLKKGDGGGGGRAVLAPMIAIAIVAAKKPTRIAGATGMAPGSAFSSSSFG
jgi:hypothetical protein